MVCVWLLLPGTGSASAEVTVAASVASPTAGVAMTKTTDAVEPAAIVPRLQVTVPGPLARGREPRCLDEVWATNQAHDSFGDRCRAGRNSHPATIFGEIRIAWSVVGGAVAVAAGDGAELVEHARAWTEDADDRFQQGQVDDLPLAVTIR